MKRLSLYLVLIGAITLLSASLRQDALDRVSIYLNSKLVGTWRADENQVIYITAIAENDTLVFKARSDVGGLGNSSIDVKDNSGSTVENIESPSSTQDAANFVYVVHFNKIDTPKISSLQVFLNVDPARNLPPPTIASISFAK